MKWYNPTFSRCSPSNTPQIHFEEILIMATNFATDSIQPPARWIQIGFLTVAVLFNLCLVTQILTVGLAVFYNSEWWNIHVWLVRGYGGLAVILFLWVYLSPFPQRVRSLTATMPVLLGLQFLTIHLKSPLPLGVFHPLIGFTLFSVSTTLVHHVQRVVFPKADAESKNI